MAKTKVRISSTFKDEIKDYARNICKNGAIDAREKMYSSARNAINAFYDHYYPRSYTRTNSLLRLSYSKYYRNDNNKKYFGGVALDPTKMTGTYYSVVSLETIDPIIPFSLAYFEGSHGKIENFDIEPQFIPPKMKPTPYDLIMNDFKNLYKDIKSGKLNKQYLDFEYNYSTIRSKR